MPAEEGSEAAPATEGSSCGARSRTARGSAASSARPQAAGNAPEEEEEEEDWGDDAQGGADDDDEEEEGERPQPASRTASAQERRSSRASAAAAARQPSRATTRRTSSAAAQEPVGRRNTGTSAGRRTSARSRGQSDAELRRPSGVQQSAGGDGGWAPTEEEAADGESLGEEDECSSELWDDSKLRGQLAAGTERVGALRATLSDVADIMRRLRSNATTVAKQERLLREQQELARELRADNQALQDDNDVLRGDQAQLRRLREEALQQKAEAAEAEQRHRKQMNEQQQLIAGVRRDLLALGGENADLRRAVADVRRVEQQLLQVRDAARADEERHASEVGELRRRLSEVTAQRAGEAAAAEERKRRELQEQRFRLLHQRAGQEEAAGRELLALRGELDAARDAAAAAAQEQQRLHDQLRQAEQRLAESLRDRAEAADRLRLLEREQAAQPGPRQLAATEGQLEDMRRRNKELQAEVDILSERLAASDSTDKAELEARLQAAELELRERGAADPFGTEHYKREAEAAADRAAELAARLSRVEASLQAKEELLRSRTAERDRLRAEQRGSVPRSLRSAVVDSASLQVSPRQARGRSPAQPGWRAWQQAEDERGVQEELRAEVSRLEVENATLRSRCGDLEQENAALRQRCSALADAVQLPPGEQEAVRRERDDTVRRLEAEVDTLQRRLAGVETTARMQVERVTRDRQQLQERVEELLQRLEDQP
eukprot:TRINITY_DN3209_c0_g2_i1.p2 TRINITY_DN3209_c0_g2~~TRINITY_DN3209_c0_g2_i1.p2  ORF type:complete len:747 (+),score=328.13 TRINITY_DN3209_c0_g2_i1:75-2243(+)